MSNNPMKNYFEMKMFASVLGGFLIKRVWSGCHQGMEVNIGSGYGLVLSGKKSQTGPMLTKIYVAICRH